VLFFTPHSDGPTTATDERSEVAIAIAMQLLELRKELGTRLAAVEECDIVAARERRFDDVAAEEDRPTEDQDVQGFSLLVIHHTGGRAAGLDRPPFFW
jgi:hypothetical protein